MKKYYIILILLCLLGCRKKTDIEIIIDEMLRSNNVQMSYYTESLGNVELTAMEKKVFLTRLAKLFAQKPIELTIETELQFLIMPEWQVYIKKNASPGKTGWLEINISPINKEIFLIRYFVTETEVLRWKRQNKDHYLVPSYSEK